MRRHLAAEMIINFAMQQQFIALFIAISNKRWNEMKYSFIGTIKDDIKWNIYLQKRYGIEGNYLWK